MLIKLCLIIWLVFTYLHIVVHFSITKQNTIYRLDDVNKSTIHNEIMNKNPFYFTLKELNYELLEPSVKFFQKYNTIEFKKYIKLHRNLECRNFYRVVHGNPLFICIHPKYKSLFKHKDDMFEHNKDIIKNIKSNGSFIHIVLKPNDILFLPNYWLLLVVTKEPAKVEKTQYSTILNQPCFKLKQYI